MGKRELPESLHVKAIDIASMAAGLSGTTWVSFSAEIGCMGKLRGRCTCALVSSQRTNAERNTLPPSPLLIRPRSRTFTRRYAETIAAKITPRHRPFFKSRILHCARLFLTLGFYILTISCRLGLADGLKGCSRVPISCRFRSQSLNRPRSECHTANCTHSDSTEAGTAFYQPVEKLCFQPNGSGVILTANAAG